MLQAFHEMHAKMTRNTQQIKVADAQMETLKRKMAHTHLVDQEMSTLHPDTRVYLGVGRM